MSDYTPSILRKHAFWQKNLVKNGIFQESSAQKGEYQPRKKGIFASESVIATVDRKKDRESLRQRRKQVDCLVLAKEGMELMSLWAGCRSKREEMNCRELELIKDDLSLIQQLAHTSFGISQLKDEITRTLSLHHQQLSIRRKAQIGQSCQLVSKGQRISEEKSSISTPPRMRASSLVRPSPVRTEPINRLPPLPEYLTPWQAPDSPTYPF